MSQGMGCEHSHCCIYELVSDLDQDMLSLQKDSKTKDGGLGSHHLPLRDQKEHSGREPEQGEVRPFLDFFIVVSGGFHLTKIENFQDRPHSFLCISLSIPSAPSIAFYSLLLQLYLRVQVSREPDWQRHRLHQTSLVLPGGSFLATPAHPQALRLCWPYRVDKIHTRGDVLMAIPEPFSSCCSWLFLVRSVTVYLVLMSMGPD